MGFEQFVTKIIDYSEGNNNPATNLLIQPDLARVCPGLPGVSKAGYSEVLLIL